MSEKSEKRFSRRRGNEQPAQADLSEVVLDAGTVDLSPTTSSIKVVTESTAIVTTGGAPETDALANSQVDIQDAIHCAVMFLNNQSQQRC